MQTPIAARLAKGLSWGANAPVYQVLCGWRRDDGAYGCGQVLGTLGNLYPAANPSRWSVSFPSAWVRGDDGVWTASRRAEQQVRRDTRLASDWRTPPAERARARDRLSSGDSTSFRRTSDLSEFFRKLGYRSSNTHVDGSISDPAKRNRHKSHRYTELPCAVRCSKCRRTNRLDGALIDEAMARWKRECADRGVPSAKPPNA